MTKIEMGLASFDEALIDERNERPLTIALVTIVIVWSLAFALTLASAHLGVRSPHAAGDLPAVTFMISEG
jgi:hypothetical protein